MMPFDPTKRSNSLLWMIAGLACTLGCSTDSPPQVKSLQAEVHRLAKRVEALEATANLPRQTPPSTVAYPQGNSTQPVLAPAVRGIRREGLLEFARTQQLGTRDIDALGLLLAKEAKEIRTLASIAFATGQRRGDGRDPPESASLANDIDRVQSKTDKAVIAYLGSPILAERWLKHRAQTRVKEQQEIKARRRRLRMGPYRLKK